MIRSYFTYQYLIKTHMGFGGKRPHSTSTDRLSEMDGFDHFAPSIGWLRGNWARRPSLERFQGNFHGTNPENDMNMIIKHH